MPLEAAFLADCPYGPEVLLLDELLEVDQAKSRVVVRMPVSEGLPLTQHQRVHAKKHPRHVSGGLMVHMTGMVGFVHAYYILGLRHAEGWTGYGVKISDARFASLAHMDELTGQGLRTRRLNDNLLARYAFQFHQGGRLVYESEQTAMWIKVAD